MLPEVASITPRLVSSQSPNWHAVHSGLLLATHRDAQHRAGWPGLEEVPCAKRWDVNLGGGGVPAAVGGGGVNVRKRGGGK